VFRGENLVLEASDEAGVEERPFTVGSQGVRFLASEAPLYVCSDW